MRFEKQKPGGSDGGRGGCPDAGTYNAECVHAEEKESSKGDPYMSLKLKLDDVNWHVFDVIMFGGKGAGMGRKKAQAFGIDVDGDVSPSDFEGKRVVVHCAKESYQGKLKLAVDSEQGEYVGYDVGDEF